MATIFEIDAAILACVDQETGEIIDPERLDALEMARADKIEGVAMWKKDSDSMAAAIGEEIKTLKARKKACESRSESLKKYLAYALGGQKFSTPKVSISFRKTGGVVVDDETALPAEYIREKVTREPDKTAMTDVLKNGGKISGAHWEDRQAVIVK